MEIMRTNNSIYFVKRKSIYRFLEKCFRETFLNLIENILKAEWGLKIIIWCMTNTKSYKPKTHNGRKI